MEDGHLNFFICLGIALGVLASILAVVVELGGSRIEQTPELRTFKFWYLAGWGICAAADWLQGPYNYVLCEDYGYDRDVIAQIFLAGFVVSGVASAFVGHLADRFGRRLACQVYCLLYISACITKHFNVYWILMIGRVTGGIATSLLFSVFESWVVSEMLHTHKATPTSLGNLLGLMYFTNYASAIAAGLVSQSLVNLAPLAKVPGFDHLYWGGATFPYDASMVSLWLGLIIMSSKWAENHGQQNTKMRASLPRDWVVWALGVVCASFESAMYLFVFNYTPSLPTSPMGIVFTLFMLASMSGASLFGLVGKTRFQPADVFPLVLLLAALALACAAASDFSFFWTLSSYIVFEATAGFYWPAAGSLKSRVVPEESRATVYNLYRIPLNTIVVVVLAGDVDLENSIIIAASLLVLASSLAVPIAIAVKRRGSSAVEARESAQPLMSSANSEERCK